MNIQLLNKLATFLETTPIPNFNMVPYVVGFMPNDLVLYVTGVLNVLPPEACAIGCGPAAGIPLLPEEIQYGTSPMWGKYLDRFTDVYFQQSWIMSPQWQYTDPGQAAAAARIRYLLVNGDVPPGYQFPETSYIPFYKEFVR